MRRRGLLALCAAAITAAPLPSQERLAPKPLIGTWEVIRLEFAGKSLRPADLRPIKVEWAAATLTVSLGDDSRQRGYTTDVDKQPHWIDVVAPAGARKLKGIYRLRDDELELCIDETGARRPAEFASKPGSNTTLLLLKRSPR